MSDAVWVKKLLAQLSGFSPHNDFRWPPKMNDQKLKIYERLVEETDRQWLGFCCYRDLGVQRTITRAYRDYSARLGKRSRKTLINAKKSGVNRYFTGWKRDFKWDERVRVWDAEGEDRVRQLMINAEAQKYNKGLSAYQQQVEAIGIAGLNLVSNALMIYANQLAPIIEKIQREEDLNERDTKIWLAIGNPRQIMAIAQMSSELMAQSYNNQGLLKNIEKVEVE
jgi:hypothetical protein